MQHEHRDMLTDLTDQSGPLHFWWLSFADGKRPQGQQFLGAAIVRGRNIAQAVQAAHKLGCNPGGEVKAQQLPDWVAALVKVGTLMDRAACAALDQKFGEYLHTHPEAKGGQ